MNDCKGGSSHYDECGCRENLESENRRLRSEKERLEPILKRMEDYWVACEGNPKLACMSCDMGDAGYSRRGPAHHDDDCLLQLVHEALHPKGEK